MSAIAREAPLRSAFLSPSWPVDFAVNGIVTYVDRLVEALEAAGHQPCIIAGGKGADTAGRHVYFSGDEKAALLRRVVDRVLFRIDPDRAVVRKFATEIVSATERAIMHRGVQILEMEETFGLAHLVKSVLPIPVVVRLHGPHFINGVDSRITNKTGFEKRIRCEGLGISGANAVSAVSKDVLDRTRAHYGLKLESAPVIPAPAPLVSRERRWRLSDCDKSRILFVGRFDRIKGGDVMLHSMRLLLRSMPKLRLWYVGPDCGFNDDEGSCWSLRDYLAAFVPEAAGAVECLGPQRQADIADLRRQSMVTVVASRYETFGIVAVEAMAYGCPLVVTNTGGLAEIVADGVTGLVCPPCDAAAMATCVSRLLTNPELAATLGQRAGEVASERYHPDRIARQTVDFHRSVLSSA